MVTYPAHICILMADLTLETGGKGKEEAGKLGSDGGSGRREGGLRREDACCELVCERFINHPVLRRDKLLRSLTLPLGLISTITYVS